MRALGVAAVVVATSVHAQEIVEIPPIAGDVSFEIEDLSSNGSVVLGHSWDGTPTKGLTPAIWSLDSGTRALPMVLGAEALRVFAISADGTTVVGHAIDPATAKRVGVRWTRGGSVTIIPPSAEQTAVFAHDTNVDGSVVVGQVRLTDGSSRAYIWTQGGGLRLLEHPAAFADSIAMAVDDSGATVVGFAQAGHAAVPCLWNADGAVTVLPSSADSDYSIAQGISGDGRRVIGSWSDDLGTYFAYVWDQDSGLIDLGLGGETNGVQSISRDGRIVAWASGSESLIFDDELGLVNVRRYLEARGLARQLPERLGVSGISSDGRTLVMAYVEGADRQYVSAILTNFTLPTNCPPDVDLNETLDAFDFLAFVNRFNAGDLRSDLDGDGTLTIADFIAFQAAFAAGC